MPKGPFGTAASGLSGTAMARAVHPDRDRGARRPTSEGARPRHRCVGGTEGPLHLCDPAEMGAALTQPRCASTGTLPARHLVGGLSGGAGRDPGAGCAEPVAECDLAPDRGMAAGI